MAPPCQVDEEEEFLQQLEDMPTDLEDEDAKAKDKDTLAWEALKPLQAESTHER